MLRNRMLVACCMLGLAMLCPALPVTAEEDTSLPEGKLTVVWSSADPDVAEKVCLMYTHAAKKYGWFAEVHLIVWGPSQRLLVGDPNLQAKVKQMQDDGVVVEACIACATKLNLVDSIKELGIEVKGMGVPLTKALKDPDTKVLTF